MSSSAAGSRRPWISRLQTFARLNIAGLYPSYAEAYQACKAAA
ncbi:MAG TPA: hypothetical protein VHI72_19310 [Hyphomicrobiaceae bacterium]|nr:hypothetical protein [Hyphomicrobiaceae bacterium]